MFKLIVKILITVAILAVIARSIDLAAVLGVVRGMQIEYLVLALVMQLLSAALASYRWYLIMRRLKFEQGPVFYLASYLKGSFFSQALPGGIGGDAYRILEKRRAALPDKTAGCRRFSAPPPASQAVRACDRTMPGLSDRLRDR